MNVKSRFLGYALVTFFSVAANSHDQGCSDPKITMDQNYRYIESNGLPCNHGQFPNSHNPNTISAQSYHFRVPLYPRYQGRVVANLGQNDFGVGLDGIPFDPGTAEWYNNDPNSGWHYDAMSQYLNLGLDQNNAHVQPNGAYHYHGLPDYLYDKLKGLNPNQMTLIGYAADGFPMYGKYGYNKPSDSQSGLKELHSSYQLKQGSRPNPPGGRYDGRFTQDYDYVQGSGDLDECNGRVGVTPEYPNGTYYYIVSDNYPFVPRCYKAEPDSSFQKQPGMGQGRGMPGGRRPPPPGQQLLPPPGGRM